VGLVVQDPATAHYGLGPYAIQLGLTALRQTNLADVAREPLETLHRQFELPTYLSVWGRMGPFILVKHEKELPTPFDIRVGFVFPLLSNATGNVFLAHMPARATRPLIDVEGKVNPDLVDQRDAICADIRKHGYAASRGHLFRGFCGLSAPVFDHEGKLAGAVTMLGVASLMDTRPRSQMTVALRQAAADISGKLGFSEER
jgi:DNA-binding IclR family transcriptional regulator